MTGVGGCNAGWDKALAAPLAAGGLGLAASPSYSYQIYYVL